MNSIGLRCLVMGCAVLAASAHALAADCPPPKPPGIVAQQDMLPGGAVVRSVAGPDIAPYLAIHDKSCRLLARLGSQGGAATSVLRFRVVEIAGLPRPLIVAVIASPGGSDTSFSTQLIAVRQGRYRALLPRPVNSLLEGGVYVGPLGGRLGVGLAVWNFIWAPSEAHVSPHRYILRRYVWDGSQFTALPTLTTRGKFTSAAPALAEFGVAYRDLTVGLPGFDQFR